MPPLFPLQAHIWVKDLGRQVYLGGYEQEEHAAEAYDIAVRWGGWLGMEAVCCVCAGFQALLW